MKLVYLFLTMVMSITIITSCTGKTIDDTKNTPNIIYYTIGNPDDDLKLVNEQINKTLSKELNATIEYNKVSWNNYSNVMNAIISSGDFDIAFASGKSQGNFIGNAQRGIWLDLSHYLKNQSNSLYQAIDSRFWKGVTINGKIYGVPTNKELCAIESFIFSKDLVDKYNIDINNYKTLKSLEPLLKNIKEKENEIIPLRLDSEFKNIFANSGYEFILDSQLPLMINSFDDSLSVVNIFETDLAKNLLRQLRKYYKLGYINSDAPIKEYSDFDGDKFFCTISSGGPYSDTNWSDTFGLDVISTDVAKPIITNQSVLGGVMTVNSQTKYPKECVKFLEILNTNSKIRNMFNYGIENVHYKLTDLGQVDIISDKYAGVPHTQGNYFLLYTNKNEPLDKWQEYLRFNSKCIESNLLGFMPNLTSINKEIENISRICNMYYPKLLTGSVDTDKFLPKFVFELKNAGIDIVCDELQKQINQWKNKNT